MWGQLLCSCGDSHYAHVGTAALGCPVERSSTILGHRRHTEANQFRIPSGHKQRRSLSNSL